MSVEEPSGRKKKAHLNRMLTDNWRSMAGQADFAGKFRVIMWMVVVWY